MPLYDLDGKEYISVVLKSGVILSGTIRNHDVDVDASTEWVEITDNANDCIYQVRQAEVAAIAVLDDPRYPLAARIADLRSGK